MSSTPEQKGQVQSPPGTTGWRNALFGLFSSQKKPHVESGTNRTARNTTQSSPITTTHQEDSILKTSTKKHPRKHENIVLNSFGSATATLEPSPGHASDIRFSTTSGVTTTTKMNGARTPWLSPTPGVPTAASLSNDYFSSELSNANIGIGNNNGSSNTTSMTKNPWKHPASTITSDNNYPMGGTNGTATPPSSTAIIASRQSGLKSRPWPSSKKKHRYRSRPSPILISDSRGNRKDINPNEAIQALNQYGNAFNPSFAEEELANTGRQVVMRRGKRNFTYLDRLPPGGDDDDNFILPPGKRPKTVSFDPIESNIATPANRKTTSKRKGTPYRGGLPDQDVSSADNDQRMDATPRRYIKARAAKIGEYPEMPDMNLIVEDDVKDWSSPEEREDLGEVIGGALIAPSSFCYSPPPDPAPRSFTGESRPIFKERPLPKALPKKERKADFKGEEAQNRKRQKQVTFWACPACGKKDNPDDESQCQNKSCNQYRPVTNKGGWGDLFKKKEEKDRWHCKECTLFSNFTIFDTCEHCKKPMPSDVKRPSKKPIEETERTTVAAPVAIGTQGFSFGFAANTTGGDSKPSSGDADTGSSASAPGSSIFNNGNSAIPASASTGFSFGGASARAGSAGVSSAATATAAPATTSVAFGGTVPVSSPAPAGFFSYGFTSSNSTEEAKTGSSAAKASAFSPSAFSSGSSSHPTNDAPPSAATLGTSSSSSLFGQSTAMSKEGDTTDGAKKPKFKMPSLDIQKPKENQSTFNSSSGFGTSTFGTSVTSSNQTEIPAQSDNKVDSKRKRTSDKESSPSNSSSKVPVLNSYPSSQPNASSNNFADYSFSNGNGDIAATQPSATLTASQPFGSLSSKTSEEGSRKKRRNQDESDSKEELSSSTSSNLFGGIGGGAFGASTDNLGKPENGGDTANKQPVPAPSFVAKPLNESSPAPGQGFAFGNTAGATSNFGASSAIAEGSGNVNGSSKDTAATPVFQFGQTTDSSSAPTSSTPAAMSFGSGSTAAAPAPPFGTNQTLGTGPVTASSAFRSTSGATTTPASFGATPAPAQFGSTPAPGTFGLTAQFGSTLAQEPFNSTPAPAPFGTAQSTALTGPSFGSTSATAGSFGTTAAAPGSFGSTPAPTVFGGSASTSAGPNFSAASQAAPAFGGTPQPPFGVPQAGNSGGFGASGGFGQQPQQQQIPAQPVGFGGGFIGGTPSTANPGFNIGSSGPSSSRSGGRRRIVKARRPRGPA